MATGASKSRRIADAVLLVMGLVAVGLVLAHLYTTFAADGGPDKGLLENTYRSAPR